MILKRVSVVSLLFSLVTIQHAFAQLPHLDLLMLTNPNVLAVSFQLPETRLFSVGQKVGVGNLRRYDVRISGDVLHSFDYHPQAHANGTLGLGMNWGSDVVTPSAAFQGTYIGSIFLQGGVESNMDSLKKYRANNYTESIGLEQEIPLTDFMRGVSSTATPAQVRVVLTTVRQIAPLDTSTLRANAGLNWSIPLVGGTNWITTGDGYWQKNVRPYAYLTSGATYRLPLQAGTFPVGIEPVAFARYVTGRRPPTYEILNNWEYGFTTNINFGTK